MTEHRSPTSSWRCSPGSEKGDVVAVTAGEDLGDFIELLGMPATVTITEGRPSVAIRPLSPRQQDRHTLGTDGSVS